MTMCTIVLRNGTLIKFDADSASVGTNALNPGGFNYVFKGPNVPQLTYVRTEQVDAVVFGNTAVIGDQLLTPISPTPAAAAPAATAPK